MAIIWAAEARCTSSLLSEYVYSSGELERLSNDQAFRVRMS